MSRPIVLHELDPDGRVVPLPTAVAEALSQTRLVEVRPEHHGRWRILPNGRVGAVRIDELQVQVVPKRKVGLTKLLFLLGYARDPGFRPEDVAGVEEPDLWAALAESLARLAERATAGGVLQGYVTVDEALRTVRGRIRISDQIARRPGFMVPVEVTYDEFTVNITENRILRTAIRRMLAVPRLSNSAAARLAHLDGRLAEVSVLRHGEALPAWRPTRLNERYLPALRLAELVLANTSAEAGDGTIRVAAFVVDMAKVFEDFVGAALTEGLRRYPGTTRLQYPDHLDEPGIGAKAAIPMYVDIVHTVNRLPRLVFDAKYKAEGPSGRYPNADHYQMLAYCTALQVPTAWLVYGGGGKPRVRTIRNTGVEVVEYPLDLRVEPGQLLAQVDRLAREAWGRSQRRESVA
ncbi:MAG: 5-methylcytosine-specific restriction enzyme subunit McrC [Actinomycetota bacterium]|nr:5-methylcytosine-specific restriction enzyme subunit McrC [Actinomycetota bacterium]